MNVPIGIVQPFSFFLGGGDKPFCNVLDEKINTPLVSHVKCEATVGRDSAKETWL